MDPDFQQRLERIAAQADDRSAPAQSGSRGPRPRLGLIRMLVIGFPLMVAAAFARRSTMTYLAIPDTTSADLAAVLPAAAFVLLLALGSLVALFTFRRWPGFAWAMAAGWIGYGAVYRMAEMLSHGWLVYPSASGVFRFGPAIGSPGTG